MSKQTRIFVIHVKQAAYGPSVSISFPTLPYIETGHAPGGHVF